MINKKVEVEGGELLLMSDEGHYAVIPAKHRQEIMDMVTGKCDDCINNYIKALPKESDYAEDGSLYGEPDKKPEKEEESPTTDYLFVEDKNDPRYKKYQDSLFLYNNNQYKGNVNENRVLSQKEIDEIHHEYNKTENIYYKNKLPVYKDDPKYKYQKLPINDRMFRPVTISYQNFSNDFNTYKPIDIENRDVYVEDKGDHIREYQANYPHIIHKTIKFSDWVDGPYYPKPTKPVFLKGTNEYENAQKQVALKEAGLYKGAIDGIWGNKSETAWNEYNTKAVPGQPDIQESLKPMKSMFETKNPMGTVTVHGRDIPYHSKEEEEELVNLFTPYGLKKERSGYAISRYNEKTGGWRDGTLYDKKGNQIYPVKNTENQILSDIYKKYPVLKNMGDVVLKADKTFTRENTGIGDIEFFLPNSDDITYTNGYEVKHPKRGSFAAVYNPDKVTTQDIALDMLHGMPEADKEYNKLRYDLGKAYLNSIYADDFYNQARNFKEETGEDKWKEWYGDEMGYFKRSYLDSIIRNLLFEGTDEDFEKAKYWKDAKKEYLSDPNINDAFMKIQKYLKQEK